MKKIPPNGGKRKYGASNIQQITSKKQAKESYHRFYDMECVTSVISGLAQGMRAPHFSPSLRTRFDKIGCLFGDSNDRCHRMPADLVWEHGCINNAEALDTEHTEVRVNNARLGRSTNTCCRSLQNLAVSSYEEGQKSGRGR